MPSKIFISYSHDSPEHIERVTALSHRLRRETTCSVRIDIETKRNLPSWPRWMRKQLLDCDFVLMVFTHKYRRRFDGNRRGRIGRGVDWEGSLITNMLYANVSRAARFIPVAFSDEDMSHIPDELFSSSRFKLFEDWSGLVKHLEPQKKIGTTCPFRPASRSLSVLFVGCQKGTGLDLRGQLRKTKAAISTARFCNSVDLQAIFDVSPTALVMKLNALAPLVLHLSGKQNEGQIKMLDDEGSPRPVSADKLADVFTSYAPRIRLIVLDTCYSLPQAKLIAKSADYAIGVERAISDPVAIDFFALFYNALASGLSVKCAHSLAYRLQLVKIEGEPRYLRELEEIIEEPFVPRMHLPQLVIRISGQESSIFDFSGE